MSVVRIKGIKRYRVRGRWFIYHRKTGTRLKSEFGTGAFFAELAAIEDRSKSTAAIPGTLGGLFKAYRASARFQDLAYATQHGYRRMMELLKPIDGMPVVELTPQFVAQLRDRLAAKHGRRQANYVLAVISVACEYGKELGIVIDNPVKGIRRVPRARSAAIANRPWAATERRNVLARLPEQLKVPVAIAMFTGLRKTDVLTLEKSAIRNGHIWRKTSKTGQEVSIPIHPQLAELLSKASAHGAPTLAATSKGQPWTTSGFNSSFVKTMAALKRQGAIEPGLTFHGLRHTVGTLLIEAGVELDIVRRWLGQKTLAMAIHYSRNANTSEQMRAAMSKLNPLECSSDEPPESST